MCRRRTQNGLCRRGLRIAYKMWVTYIRPRQSLTSTVALCARTDLPRSTPRPAERGQSTEARAQTDSPARSRARRGSVSASDCTAKVNGAPCLRVSSTGFLHNCFRFLLRVYFNKSSTGNLHVYLLLKIAEYQKPRSSHSRRAGYECRTNSPNKIQSTSNQKRTPSDSLSATMAPRSTPVSDGLHCHL